MPIYALPEAITYFLIWIDAIKLQAKIRPGLAMDIRFDIKGDRHAAKVVDDFLAADKLITGEADWVWYDQSAEYRRTYVVTVDGIPTGATLELIAYPMLQEQKIYPFTITLNFPPCVERLEVLPSSGGHTNPFKEYSDYDQVIRGSHYHGWEDNKYLAKANDLPKELDIARVLPVEIKAFDSATRWFCQRTNIIIEKHQYLELPPRSWLL